MFTGSMTDSYRSKTFSFEGIVSEQDARAIQAQAGYDSAGYGFYGFMARTFEDGTSRTQWTCGGSCD